MKSLKSQEAPGAQNRRLAAPLTWRQLWYLRPSARAERTFSSTAATHCFINSAFIQQTFQCPKALIYLRLSQSVELDIALYNLSSGVCVCVWGGVAITSHQLSLQPATANRKVSNVADGGEIREKNPENSKAMLWGEV